MSKKEREIDAMAGDGFTLIKALDEITLDEWTRYQWLDVTKAGDELRTYVRGQQRTPEDATAAYYAFCEYQKVTRGV